MLISIFLGFIVWWLKLWGLKCLFLEKIVKFLDGIFIKIFCLIKILLLYCFYGLFMFL